MIHKLLLVPIVAFVGLNISLGICETFADDDTEIYVPTYQNLSSKSIQLVFIGDSQIDSFNIVSNDSYLNESDSFDSGGDPVIDFIETKYTLEVKVRLYCNDQLLKEWTGPVGSFGTTNNNPFNYDSWTIERYSDDTYDGTIIFTITDKDLTNFI